MLKTIRSFDLVVLISYDYLKFKFLIKENKILLKGEIVNEI
jgi:hypothetical protein